MLTKYQIRYIFERVEDIRKRKAKHAAQSGSSVWSDAYIAECDAVAEYNKKLETAIDSALDDIMLNDNSNAYGIIQQLEAF